MNNEPLFIPHQAGWTEITGGSLFSGKTKELIRRAKRIRHGFPPPADKRQGKPVTPITHPSRSADHQAGES